MHKNVRASHDRARLQHDTVGERITVDNNYVYIGDCFAIISLRDAHGISHAWSETHLAALRGYRYFVRATIDETLNPFILEGD